MLAHFPSNCSLISTSLTRCVVSNGTTFTEQVCRCVPNMEAHSIRLYALGHTSKVLYRPACITSGVNTREVHEYNVSTGWALPDERTEEEREAESIRTSVSRSVRMVRELAACNQWQFFVTITLSPKHWENRYTPDGLQDVIKLMAKRWRRKRTNGSAYCPGFKYLLIPEMHKDGAIHLHGFVSCMPSKDCVPYTLDEVNGEQNLPREICNKVRAGQEVYHCNEWEQFFGFNTIEPISDLDKASSYVVKYVSKEIGKTPFKTRYWCSRGLSRATLVGKFYFSDEYLVEPQLEFYNQSLASMAAVTKSNFLMHEECFAPLLSRQHLETGCYGLVNITTYINGCDHSSAEVLAFLNSNFDTTPHYVEYNQDANFSPARIAKAVNFNHFIHDAFAANALDSELSELQAANDAGRLEIIHGQPFITLPKDDPCADLFDTLSYTPAPQKHKPLPPCHSSPHLQQCEQLSLFKFHLPN